MNNRYLITGCSGGGKSTLIQHLRTIGFDTVGEPGLRIIRSGGPTPWEDRDGFFEAVAAQSKADLLLQVNEDRPLLYDRGLFDALSGCAERDRVAINELMRGGFPYAEPVFFAPVWPEIFEQTAERPHSLKIAADEANRLRKDLADMGIAVAELPRVSVHDRADFVLSHLP